MTKRVKDYVTRRPLLWLAVVVLVCLIAALAVFANSATLTTDKLHYYPDEVVTVYGEYFAGDTSYDLPVIRPDGTIVKGDGSFEVGWDTVTADADGAFTYAYQLDGIWGGYEVRAYPAGSVTKDDSGNVVLPAQDPIASVTFTDYAVDFMQCSNENPTLGDCYWIGSILQQNNSRWHENMGVPQRIILVDIPATTGNLHWLTFSHQASKASAPAHAYDWLMSYDQAEVIAAELGVPFNDLDGQTCDAAIGPKVTTAECNALRTGPNCVDVDVPNDAYVSNLFGVGTGSYQDRINAFEMEYGNRTIRICGDAAISSTSLALEDGFTGGHSAADDSSSDDAVNYRLNWTSTSEQVLIMAAGHLSSGSAATNGWGWGEGFGSASISGGPYHFYLDKVDDTTLGNQDNQIKGADILLLPADKFGSKWHDLNGDGVWDDQNCGGAGEPTCEPGLEGWTIWVDYDDDGALNGEEPSDVTDATGAYLIEDIHSGGPWKVRELQPASDTSTWFCSFPATSDAYGCYHEETFEDGTTYGPNNFGNYQQATKEGVKYEDTDGDGAVDDETDTINGVDICAYADADQDGVPDDPTTSVLCDTTAGAGEYSLLLDPGSYVVCEFPPAATPPWIQSYPDAATGGGDCSGVTGAADVGWAITLESGDEDLDNDFGNYRRGCLDITKIVEGNGDVDPLQEFEICIKGPSYPNGDEPGACQTIGYLGGTLTWNNLIPGEYEFDEVDPGPPWLVDYDPASKTIIVLPGEVCAIATVTNAQKYIGFTPGFWKNHGEDAPSGKNAWEYLTYEEGDLIGDVFCDSYTCAILSAPPKKSIVPMGDHSLMEGLSFKGGPGPEGAAEILLRAGIAALLNADISDFLGDAGLLNGFAPYPYTVEEVLDMVSVALDSGDASTMLGVATDLDDINNDASHWFDWYPPY